MSAAAATTKVTGFDVESFVLADLSLHDSNRVQFPLSYNSYLHAAVSHPQRSVLVEKATKSEPAPGIWIDDPFHSAEENAIAAHLTALSFDPVKELATALVCTARADGPPSTSSLPSAAATSTNGRSSSAVTSASKRLVSAFLPTPQYFLGTRESKAIEYLSAPPSLPICNQIFRQLLFDDLQRTKLYDLSTKPDPAAPAYRVSVPRELDMSNGRAPAPIPIIQSVDSDDGFTARNATVQTNLPPHQVRLYPFFARNLRLTRFDAVLPPVVRAAQFSLAKLPVPTTT
jgi:hypothetical protein